MDKWSTKKANDWSKKQGWLRGFNYRPADCRNSVEIFQEYGVEKISQEELFAKADIVSVHVPIIPSTHHLICRETIAGMKDGVMILNTSRGPIVDIKALVEGLHSGKVCAAGLDVVEGEPISDPHHPLLS